MAFPLVVACESYLAGVVEGEVILVQNLALVVRTVAYLAGAVPLAAFRAVETGVVQDRHQLKVVAWETLASYRVEKWEAGLSEGVLEAYQASGEENQTGVGSLGADLAGGSWEARGCWGVQGVAAWEADLEQKAAALSADPLSPETDQTLQEFDRAGNASPAVVRMGGAAAVVAEEAVAPPAEAAAREAFSQLPTCAAPGVGSAVALPVWAAPLDQSVSGAVFRMLSSDFPPESEAALMKMRTSPI